MEGRLGKRVFQFGVEKLVEEIVITGRPHPGSMDYARDVLAEVQWEPSAHADLNPAQLLEFAKRAMEEGGRRKVREVCGIWGESELLAVICFILHEHH
jgi:hypothetical protein